MPAECDVVIIVKIWSCPHWKRITHNIFSRCFLLKAFALKTVFRANTATTMTATLILIYSNAREYW